MKFLFWHIHEWVHNENQDKRKCVECGRLEYLTVVGHDTPHYDWSTKGYPCEKCWGTGNLLIDGEIKPCDCDNGWRE